MKRRDFIKQTVSLLAATSLPAGVLREAKLNLLQQLPQNIPVGYAAWATVGGDSVCFLSTENGPKILEGGLWSIELLEGLNSDKI